MRPGPVMLPGNPFETLLLLVAVLGGVSGLIAGTSVPPVDVLTPELTVPFNALLTSAGVIGLAATLVNVHTGLLIERVAMGLLAVLLLTWAVLSLALSTPVLATIGVFAHAGAVVWRLWQNVRDIARLRHLLHHAAERHA